MANHYKDRNLVKQPKSIRFDAYQEQMIEAVANWEGTDFTSTVRELCEEAIEARIQAILANKRRTYEGNHTDKDVI